MRFSTFLGMALFSLILGFSFVTQADEATYIYDELGRLIRVIDGQGNVATYNYDAVGNLLEITGETVAGLQPTINSITPNFGRQGSGVDITITGTKLEGSTLTTNNTGIIVANAQVTDTTITARFLISETATLGVTTVQVDNGVGTASLGYTIHLRPPAPVIAPSVLSVVSSGGTTTASISLESNDGFPTVLTLITGDTQIATVDASQLILQPGESKTVTITGGVSGNTKLEVTSADTTTANIFVDQLFSGGAFNASDEVSVIIDAGPVPPTTETISPILGPSISVKIDVTTTPTTQSITPILGPLIGVKIDAATTPTTQNITPLLAPLISVENP